MGARGAGTFSIVVWPKLTASAIARAYNGVWGQSPQLGPGAKPLVWGSPQKLLYFATKKLNSECNFELSHTIEYIGQ